MVVVPMKASAMLVNFAMPTHPQFVFEGKDKELDDFLAVWRGYKQFQSIATTNSSFKPRMNNSNAQQRNYFAEVLQGDVHSQYDGQQGFPRVDVVR